MKAIKIALLFAALTFISAPAIAQTSLSTNNGSFAGKALLGLYTQYKADGKLDLANPTNLANLATLAKNIKNLAQTAKTANFVKGLISGSKNLVNNDNSSTVLSSLKSLSKLDLSALQGAAVSKSGDAAKNVLNTLGSAAANASSSSATKEKAASILTNLFNKLK